MRFKRKLRNIALSMAVIMIFNIITMEFSGVGQIFVEIYAGAEDETVSETTAVTTVAETTTVTTVPTETEETTTAETTVVTDTTESTENTETTVTTESTENTETTVTTETTETTATTETTESTETTGSTELTEAAEEEEESVDGGAMLLEDSGKITINNADDLINYSEEYLKDPVKYQNIDVEIALSSGNLSTLLSFSSIGTENYPFAATLTIGSGVDFTLDKPFFAYIKDSAKITSSNGDMYIIRAGTSDSALFAENVVHDPNTTTPAQWALKISSPDETSFAGVIGIMGEGALVDLSVNVISGNNSVVSGRDAGFACGTMKSGSKLTVSMSGATNNNVSSTGANAGGLVGKMEKGSEFVLKTAYLSSGTVTSSEYAGGLVGYAEDATVKFESGASISGTINGAKGTGGVFGYYSSSKKTDVLFGYYTSTDPDNSFDLANYKVNCTLDGENSGGIFGELSNGGYMTLSSSVADSCSISVNRTSENVQNYGGIIGKYYSDQTSNALEISGITVSINKSENSKASNYGGAIAEINDDSYVYFKDITITAGGCAANISNFGGLVGYFDKAFIDAENIKIITSGNYSGGGIIGNMVWGVLRLSGTTDLGGTQAGNGGQIIGNGANHGLVYALDGWKFIRSSTPAPYDDIGNWGTVLRLGSELSLSESNLFDVDMTEHTVKLKEASTTVNSLADFVKLALNIQYNDGTAERGTLLFDNTTKKCSELLKSDITLNCNIKLTDTGLTGLTRDDGNQAGGSGEAKYTGTFNGNGHTITLGTGVPFGYRGNDSTIIKSDDTSDGTGCIHRHYYNALFAMTGDGASFKNITIDGQMNVSLYNGTDYYACALVGNHMGGDFTADHVTVTTNINLPTLGTNYAFAAGILGRANKELKNSTHNIVLESCTASPRIIAPDISTNSNVKLICGGAIGEISGTETFSVTANNVTVGAELLNPSTFNNKKIGGFIGNISNASSNVSSINRTVTLTNIKFDGAKITSVYGGALLGEEWNNTTVTVGSALGTNDGITVTNCEVTKINNNHSNKNFAGLMTYASGYWQVYHIDISDITVTGNNAGSFGMLVNSGISDDNSKIYALYLELKKPNAYKINKSGVNISLNDSAVYDDIIATCTGEYDSTDKILTNGNCAVVSIRTTGDSVIMDGSACNTYQDGTDRTIENPNSRYYYNLDVFREKDPESLTDPEKLMLWSLNKYAYSNIKQYFPTSIGNEISAGSYDMTGYSYYPINVGDAITVASGSRFVFCNDKIELGESLTGNTDNKQRTTVGTTRTQHYLMHCGLFCNVSENITAEGMEFAGSVGGDNSYCGAFICGTVAGTNEKSVNIVIDGVTLDGIIVTPDSADNPYSGDEPLPLLINRIDSYSSLTLSGVSTTSAYKTAGITKAATSLIGDAGKADGTSSDIKLTFSRLTLDGRKEALDDTANTALNTAYNTDLSIFSKAILLNSFKFGSNSGCSGSYNFYYNEDWNEDNSPLHNVAYGYEISGTREYLENDISVQKLYMKSAVYINPESPNSSDDNYSFEKFLPYVYTPFDADASSNICHEIKINHFSSVGLDKGCGTYNDPYILSSGKSLEILDKILAGNLGETEDGAPFNYKDDCCHAWCDGKNSHHILFWDFQSKSFVNNDKSFSVSPDEMQQELSTAYFMFPEIETNEGSSEGQNANKIVISSSEFVGLGKKIPFKGVIIGSGRTIDNQTISPLIYNSQGSVIKDLNLEVSADFTDKFTGDANSKYDTDGGTAAFYGGLIGIVNGGDNIIDNVGITFTNAGTINIKNGECYGNKAIGGYIGVVRYGGVIFRNMDSVNNKAGITDTMNSMFNEDRTRDFKENIKNNAKVLLYCNPIIGRVIDGYAVTESTSYNGNEENVTMHNGTKNYSITNIDKTAEKIAFGEFTNPKGDYKKGTVYVKDAQQMFLLGCISMSGGGSADEYGNYPSTYSYGTGKMTRLAQYTDVGTNNTAADTADYSVASTDSYAQNNVPYIIYKYTAETTTYSETTISYPAKRLTNEKFVFDMELAQGTYDMPDGFRGIGSLNNNAENLKMYINGIRGNDSVINLNMNFYMYKKDYDKYYIDNLNSSREYKVGLGLFNTLVQNRSTFTPENYQNEENINRYTISGLTFTGNVNHEVYSDINGNIQKSDSYFSVAGGLAGASYASNLIINNVKMSQLTVNSRYISGGLIGSVTGKNENSYGNCRIANITNFSAENANAKGGAFAGGLIGYAKELFLLVDGDTTETKNCTFRIGEISSSFNHGNFDNDNGIGGLIGTVQSRNSNADYSVSVRNVDLEGGSLCGGGDSSFVGGVIGCLGDKDNKMKTVNITNINLTGVDIWDSQKKVYCGGVIGTIKRSVVNTEISDVHLKGTGSGNYVEGKSQAGGIVGLVINNLTIDKCSVENYTLRSTENDIKTEGVGGFVAKAENTTTICLKNSRISNCSLQCREKMQVGAVAGSIVGTVKFGGYNIVIENVSVSKSDNNNSLLNSNISGDIAGLLQSGCELKLVGVSKHKNGIGPYMSTDIGTNEGTGYIIYSDYKGNCLTEAANKENSTINAQNNVTDCGSDPYATINPKKTIDNSVVSPKFLTGNGVDKAVINSILSEIGAVKGYNNVVSEYNDIFKQYESMLTTFNDKTAASMNEDIPILIINDSNYKNITKMLNSYIHILTNDTSVTNYANADSSICTVDIIPMRLSDSGVFETGEEFKKTLEMRNGYFRMTDLDYDSNYKQFTLIDIRYADPMDTAKTAYHLYIPVYVEKMLYFDFTAAALSGTNYNVGAYTDGNAVLENYGTPVTAHITYSYKRTPAEWQKIINGGEALLTNYGKTVLLKGDNDLPDDTQLVLVDRNNGSKAYYSTIGESGSNSGTSDILLDLGSFRSADGTSFDPITFSDMLNKSAVITAKQDANGLLVKCSQGDTSDAIIVIGGEYYRRKTDSDTDESNLYSAELVPDSIDPEGYLVMKEDYYLSFFTKEDESAKIRNITITCSTRLKDDGMTPSHLDNENSNQSMVHMILGNLYDQTFTFKTTGGEVISEGNNALKAELKTEISLKSESASEIRPYLNDSTIHLYHGFIIEAVRKDEDGVQNGFKGAPRVTGTYTIDGVSYLINATNTDPIIDLSELTGTGPKDIKEGLKKVNKVIITCTDLTITYTDGESIIAQFPERKMQSDTYGVTLSANSELAYNSDNIGSSNMSVKKPDESGKSYYRENIAEATLSYNIPVNTPKEISKLGINGRDNNDSIRAVGYYNLMNLPETAFNNGDKVKFVLSLYRKNNEGSYEQVPIDTYLADIAVYDKNGSPKAVTKNGDSYEYVFNKEGELNFEAGTFEVMTEYSVITGAEFESDDISGFYANYKVQLTAMLLDSSGVSIENTGCSDYIIYTNAKINSQMQSAQI